MESSRSALSAPATEHQAQIFAVGSLLKRLEALTDSRGKKGKRYALPIILLLISLAKLSGEDRPSGIADWVRLRKAKLLAALRLSWRRMPHHNTYRRIMAAVIKPEELEREVSDFLKGLPGVGRSALLTLDGKTVRGTIGLEKPHGEHLLAAYLPEEGICLFQVAAENKENEIVAAPKLLEGVDLRGKVVAGDAEQTQRKLSLQILEAGGEYLWFVKDNQPKLREEIVDLFELDDRTVLGAHIPHDFQMARTLDKGHGRQELRQITVSSELKGYSEWPGLAQVFRLERRRHKRKSGEKTVEIVYGLTSLQPEEASAERLLYLSRAYWGIENGLHHRRDATFHEDATRQTKGRAGWVMATMNNLVISLLCYSGATNLAQARRECEADLSRAMSVLTASLIK